MIKEQKILVEKIAKEINASVSQVEAAISLLDEGATVPFIARYRKEKTNGLDDGKLRALHTRLKYLRELNERREAIIHSISEQNRLTDELENSILNADSKIRLEDLYLPYRLKRRTKASIAQESGLEPLANLLLQDLTVDIEASAEKYINKDLGVESVSAAVEGARQILMERFAESPDLLKKMRDHFWKHGVLNTTTIKGKKDANKKYADYVNYAEKVSQIPSHRALAVFRGRSDNSLKISLSLPDNDDFGVESIFNFFNIEKQSTKCCDWLIETAKKSWSTKLFAKVETAIFKRLRDLADSEAIRVFSINLRDLLLAAPAGGVVTLGLDPGIRTGVKVAIVDNTGKLLDHCVLFPFGMQNEWHQSIAMLAKLTAKYDVKLISIGNGTGSRETIRLVNELIKMYPDFNLTKVLVSEAGASVYSASELAANEFPDLDVSIRGAVSIARRLQDPLSELVKIDPKSIGVGQYQHDVNQTNLQETLEDVVEDCVCSVGVDINLASVNLLSRVCGLNTTLAKNIVKYRDEKGFFKDREELKKVGQMGPKTYQQAAGFLRINNGDNPLDSSGVHPESYFVVEKILADKKLPIKQVIGNSDVLSSIKASDYTTENLGIPSITDILKELLQPGRDPRPEFKFASFKEGIEEIADLYVGLELEGVVSNVTNFGAFVDIGVHQDGLVHISSMSNKFVSDPRMVVKALDIVKVKVLEVDKDRRRISLTMNLDDKTVEPTNKVARSSSKKVSPTKTTPKPQSHSLSGKKKAKSPLTSTKPVFNTAMADALTKLKKGDA
ncbi:MAG: Tex family protein [Legionellaceae bacterium]|nr:Tex family protein [Legionellaceae bacterium]